MFGTNPYIPYGYNFMGQQMPQQMGQQMGMQNQYQQPNHQAPQNQSPALLQVSTTKQVEQVTVQPGSKALVLVQNEPVIAMRTADQMGLAQTDYYRIEKFDPAQAVQPVPQQDYVTRAEFEQTIQNLLNNINKPTKPAKAKEATE